MSTPPAGHPAAQLLADAMTKAFGQNERRFLYRTLPLEQLLGMLDQNMAELKLALLYDNDVSDKVADVANYLSFVLENYLNGQRPTSIPGARQGRRGRRRARRGTREAHRARH